MFHIEAGRYGGLYEKDNVRIKIAMETILLVGHGSKSEKPESIRHVAVHLHHLIHPECNSNCIRVAYLQFAEPTIMEAIEEAVTSGAKRIIIHPYFLHSGVHVTEHIPKIVNEANSLYSDVEFICTEHLGAHEKIAEVVLERVRAAIDLKDNS
jgi:sirohydrochlorin ferrochelatase